MSDTFVPTHRILGATECVHGFDANTEVRLVKRHGTGGVHLYSSVTGYEQLVPNYDVEPIDTDDDTPTGEQPPLTAADVSRAVMSWEERATAAEARVRVLERRLRAALDALTADPY